MVLVDGENIHAQHADSLLTAARKLGSIVEARVYAHYANPATAPWKQECESRGLIAVDVSLDGDDTADFLMTIEAVDLLHTRLLDAFCLVSNDAHFASIAQRIKRSAKPVYGIGSESSALQQHVDKFVPLSPDVRNAATPSGVAAPPLQTLLDRIESLSKDGWTRLSDVGHEYDARKHGYSSLSKLIRKRCNDRIEFKPGDNGKVRVRHANAAETAPPR
jgi:hypothetical protein